MSEHAFVQHTADLRRHQSQTSGCPFHAIFSRDAKASRSTRFSIFALGLIAYAMFFGTFNYAIGFTTSLFVPKNINSGTFPGWTKAITIDSTLLILFVLQHTIMARPWFKEMWTKIVPTSIERSIFVFAASVCLGLICYLWQPMPQVMWDWRTSTALSYYLTGMALFGYFIVLMSSFMVSHFDLFGLRQVWLTLQDKKYEPIAFRLVGLYKLVRHPLMVGFLIAFWCTPYMTAGHLFFAVMTTGYIFFGTWIEERDLMKHFGETYAEYRKRVRGFIPLPRKV